MTKRKKNLSILIVLPVAMLLMVSACSQRTTPPDTLVTALTSSIDTLDPLFTTGANPQHLNQLIHGTLVRIGNSLVPKPYVASEMHVLDEKTIRFRLKENCQFHDGSVMSADDVIYSWETFISDKHKSPFSEAFRKIEKIIKNGSHDITIHTKEVAPSLMVDFSLMKIIPARKYDPKKFRHNPIGLGPYKVAHANQSEILLEQHDSKCLEKGKMPKILAKIVREDLNRFLKLKNGEIDIVLNDIDKRKVKKVQENKDDENNLVAISEPGVTYSYMGVNFAKEELSKPLVRQAIAYAINIPKIIKFKLAGMATPAASVLPESSWFYNQKLSPIDYNLEKSKKLLDRAGYFNGSNDKPPLKLTLKTTSNKMIIENAQVIIAQLKSAGIKVEHKAYEWGLFYGDVKARNTELYLLRWVGATDPGIMYDIFHSSNLERNNRTNYKSALTDKYLDLGQSTLDLAKRKSAFDKVQEIVLEELPYIHLWHNMNAAIYRSNIKGVELSPTGAWYSFLNIYKEVTKK